MTKYIFAAQDSNQTDRSAASVVMKNEQGDNLGRWLELNARNNDVVELRGGTYKWATSEQNDFTLPSNFTMIGVGNVIINANWGSVNSGSRHYIVTTSQNTTFTNLKFKGRIEICPIGNNSKYTDVDVDQSTDAGAYQGLMGLQAGWFFKDSCSGSTFTRCSANKTWHHGWTCNREGITISNITWTDCSANHCGSGLVAWPNDRDDSRNGLNSRWSAGFDLLDSSGTLRGLHLIRFKIDDAYQSGFHIDGSWEGHEQTIDVTFDDCVATNCGVRSFIYGYQWSANPVPGVSIGIREQPPVLFSSGFYLGSGVTLNNCSTANCARAGFQFYEAGNSTKLNNCHDKGSNVSLLVDGVSNGIQVNGFTAEASKYFALIFNGRSIFKGFNIIDFAGSGHPIWYGADVDLRDTLANEEKNLESGNIQYYNGEGKASAFKQKYYNAGGTGHLSQSGTTFTLFSNQQSLIGKTLRDISLGRFSDSPNGMDLSLMVSQFNGVVSTIPTDSHVCDELTCTDGIQYRWDCASKTYIATGDNTKCNPDYCQTVGDVKCVGGIRYVCGSNHLWGSTSMECGEEATSGFVYTLNKNTPVRIDAKNYDAYSDIDTVNEGNSGVRTSEGVDLVTWDSRAGTESGATVVAYTADTEWLKYKVKVADKGTYSIKFRASTPNVNCSIGVTVNGAPSKVECGIPTTTGYEVFGDSSEYTLPTFDKDNSTIVLSFKGDMNLNWFELKYLNGIVPSPLPDDDKQIPFNPSDIRFDGHVTINGYTYDIGGEGVSFHTSTPSEEPNDRGDSIKTVSANNDTETAIVGKTDDWLKYTVTIVDTSGYNVDFYASSSDSASALKLTYGGVDYTMPIGNTGGVTKRFTLTDVALSSGVGTLTITFNRTVSFTRMEIYGYNQSVVTESTPYRGEGKSFKMPMYQNDTPLTIQAEYFNQGVINVAYADDTLQNLSNEVVRAVDTSVDIFTNKDYSVTAIDWTNKKEWLTFSVNVGSSSMIDLPEIIEPETINFIAVGYGTNTMAYSYDGKTWVGEGFGNIYHNSSYSDIIWNGSIWVAVGNGLNGNPPITWSNDGLIWYASNAALIGSVLGIAWNGRRFVAVGGWGGTPVIWSDDGITWYASTGNIPGTAFSVAWNGSVFVVVGLSSFNMCIWSEDGINWNKSNIADTLYGGGIYDVSWNGKVFVALGWGEHTQVWSNDGKTWYDVSPTIFLQNSISEFSGTLVASDEMKSVAVGGGSNSLSYSYDGKQWTNISNTLFGDAGECVSYDYVKKIWVAGVNTTKLAWSNDGINWNISPSDIFYSNCYGIASKNELYRGAYWNDKLPAVTHTITVVANSWSNFNNTISAPYRINIQNNEYVYISTTNNNLLKKFTLDGTLVAQIGGAGSGDGQFYGIAGITFDSNNNMYIVDNGNNRIQKFDSTGTFIMKWGSEGSGNNQFSYPADIVCVNNNILVADTGNNRLQMFTSDGTFMGVLGGSGSENGQFNTPRGITIDNNNNIYVVDTGNHRIQKFDVGGNFVYKWGVVGSDDGQFNQPFDITTDSNGNIYVADSGNHRIQKFTTDGVFISKIGGIGSGEWQFNYPYSIAIDNNENIYVADYSNNRVVKYYDCGGIITPNNVFTITNGNYVTFSLTPNSKYHIENILIDDIPTTVNNGIYTLVNIVSDHVVKPVFKTTEVYINLHDFKIINVFQGITKSIAYGDNVGNTGGTLTTPKTNIVLFNTTDFKITCEDGGGGTYDTYYEITKLTNTTMQVVGNVVGTPFWTSNVYYKNVLIGSQDGYDHKAPFTIVVNI